MRRALYVLPLIALFPLACGSNISSQNTATAEASKSGRNEANKDTNPMTELKFLDKYSGQTVDELIALEGKYRIDSLVLAFEQAVQQKVAKVGMNGLTEEERIVLAVEALEREVNNGGYDQFFVNSSKEFAPFIVGALNRIGCEKTARITQEAIDSLEITGPITTAAIEKAIYVERVKREAALNQCDNRFYEYEEDIAEYLFAFIKKNRNCF